MKKKKSEDISRRAFINDTGKTLFYTAMAASVIPAFLSTSCTKDSGTDPQNPNLVSSGGGLKSACTHGFNCNDQYECGKGSFNCNHGFTCPEPDVFQCTGPNFHCHNAFNGHYGGKGG